MRTALVTGATGFIGAHLVRRLLRDGVYVVALVRDGQSPATHVVHGALEDYDTVLRAVTKHDVDTVFHLGAQSLVGHAVKYPRGTFETNIRGTYNVLEACRVAGVERVVVASSDKAYGSSETPYDEATRLQGEAPYDVSKSCADLLAQAYGKTYAMPVAIARLCNVYGPGDTNWSRLIPGTIRSVLAGKRPAIRSCGTPVREYLYIDDAVDAYLELAEAETHPGQAFNFGGERSSVLDLVCKISEMTAPIILPAEVLGTARNEIMDQTMDDSLARETLGWSRGVTLRDGLRHTIAWHRNGKTAPGAAR